MIQPTLVFYTQLYYPDVATTAVIMTELAEDLALNGFNVFVNCAQPFYRSKEITLKNECHHGVLIKRVWTTLFDKNLITGRILNGVSFFLNLVPTLIFAERNALFCFNTNPALLPGLGLVAAKILQRRYLVLVHDLWPELPANIHIIKKGGLIYRLINLLNTASLRYANGIIAISDKMSSRILQKIPEKKEQIHVISNWADANKAYPVHRNHNHLLQRLGLAHKKVVMYSGNLGRYQPLEVIIGAADHLKHKNDIMFVFAGEGAKKQKIKKMAASLQLNNVMLIPFQPPDRLAESLSMADVSLVGIYPENEGVVMPSKLYSLLAIGKPIICISDPSSEVAQLLKIAGAGLHSSVDDPRELAQKISYLLDDTQKAEEMGCNGRNYFLDNFERKRITMRWKNLLENITRTG
jgi:glycosyltransferase involved in cell wall biosynthesis